MVGQAEWTHSNVGTAPDLTLPMQMNPGCWSLGKKLISAYTSCVACGTESPGTLYDCHNYHVMFKSEQGMFLYFVVYYGIVNLTNDSNAFPFSSFIL